MTKQEEIYKKFYKEMLQDMSGGLIIKPVIDIDIPLRIYDWRFYG